MALFGAKKESASAEATADKEKQKTSASDVVVPKIPSVLIQPRISEKAGRQSLMNKYVFLVRNDANKVSVKKAIETFYKVHVTQVNIVRNQGKTKNFGNRTGKTSDFKKAIVTLKKGDKIEGLTDVV